MYTDISFYSLPRFCMTLIDGQHLRGDITTAPFIRPHSQLKIPGNMTA
jgi:hypothetical protein